MTFLPPKVFILLLLIFSCVSIKRPFDKKREIIGKWCSKVEQFNYPTITFTKDSLAVLSSSIDTIYYYRYFVNDNYLHLQNYENKKAEIQILRFTKDSLILVSLLENKGKQTYYKCGSE